jgi:hypothetical protein
MNYSSGRHETLWASAPHQFKRWPISAVKLISLIDLGWSDYRIACHFCIEPEKVSALRAYDGLVRQAHDPWVWQLRQRNRPKNEG